MAFVFLLRKGPKIGMILILFVNVFLLAFLLVGCTTSESRYSDVYLLQYEFNQSSSMFPLIESAYEKTNSKSMSKMKVRVGYKGICVEANGTNSCSTSLGSTDYKSTYPGVSLYNTGSNSTTTSMNLVDIAVQYNAKVSEPFVLMASLVLTLLLLVSLVYGSIPFLPWKHVCSYTSFSLSAILCILWGIGAMWAHVAANAGAKLSATSSMTIVAATIGSRAAAMIWCSFSFYIVALFGTIFGLVAEIRRRRDLFEKDSKSLASSMSGSHAAKNPFENSRFRQFV
ncbi:hypothetical protein OGAPHI_004487 [Ogataea philodendri]|uniref:Uncharacterized protein n=1 Tax=Ogataea philodendri TaxID=1378263 RepID=A0A9P8P699_9ASCO|nr:uncharacterized protein OGAPHI_004487 [Ogataea philodendri]KAH3666298.1 hypothetical protein OGAPHI_004487 [Ogataea philodendri]